MVLCRARSATTSFAKKKIPLFLVSAATGDGVRELLLAVWKKLDAKKKTATKTPKKTR